MLFLLFFSVLFSLFGKHKTELIFVEIYPINLHSFYIGYLIFADSDPDVSLKIKLNANIIMSPCEITPLPFS